VLGGAFNTPGPPVIVYGNLKQWPRDLFRSTLQALFLFSSSLVIASHAVAGNLTRAVLTTYLLLVPALLLGVWAGAWVDRHISNQHFRILVLALIFATGVLLLICTAQTICRGTGIIPPQWIGGVSWNGGSYEPARRPSCRQSCMATGISSCCSNNADK
jgi:hypothetical protein